MLPERRPKASREALQALERGDEGPLLRGLEVYLARVEGMKPTTVTLHRTYLGRFLRFLRALGRTPETWDYGDYLRMLEEFSAEGLEAYTRLRFFYMVKAFLRFLEWAGVKTPPLDLGRPHVAFRKSHPLTDEEYRKLLELVRSFPSRWRMPLLAIAVLAGETGLRLKDMLPMTLDHVSPSGEVRLPGGKTLLSPSGKRALEEYLAWRGSVAPPGYPFLLVTPRGRPFRPEYLSPVKRFFQEYAGAPFEVNRLRLTGQARLVRRRGAKEARRLLRRITV